MTDIFLPLTLTQVEALLELLLEQNLNDSPDDLKPIYVRLQYERRRKQTPYPLNQVQP